MTLLDEKHSTFDLQHLVSIYKLMKDNKDNKNAHKILELYEKLEERELVISFAGHFSAGKSSMINTLLGKEILPKSPIPTSANIVKITSGNGSARIFFHHDAPIEYKEPYDIEMIKAYCKDKDTIKRIELSTSEALLPEGCSLIDTPGIDAADDADRLMTESSLHLVDVLFYVMDYNHVQSEVNLYFLKGLQEKGIPFFIIINQVDKHNEAELSFETFEKSIKQTFDQWKIFPSGIYYSSLVDFSAKHNQINEIEEMLFKLLRKDRNLSIRIDQAVQHVIDQHKIYLEKEAEEKLADFANENIEVNNLSQLKLIEEKLKEMKSFPEQVVKDFNNDLNLTMKNAYLMPAALRDQATLFLESQQKDFKVGIFASKKKTNEEKVIRLNTFLNALQKNIEAVMQWKLRDKILDLLKKHNISDHELIKRTQQLAVIYTAEELIALTKPGATINGNYVLNYTNEVSSDIKNKFKVQARKLGDSIHNFLTNEMNEKTIEIEKRKRQLERAYGDKQAQEIIHKELEEKMKSIDNELENPSADKDVWESIQIEIKQNNQTIKQFKPIESVSRLKPNETKKIKLEETDKKTSNHTITSIIQSINQTIETIEALPVFQSIVEDLKKKQQRLDNRTLTIALFGAFSAGKSSFANALFGESLLPVSPNPTTAVINRISPVTEEFEHGTVVIKLKNNDVLINDLLSITKNFSPTEKEFTKLITWIEENKIHENNELNKMYQAYLGAMIAGYNLIKDSIGQTITINIDKFANYITDETKACYIDSVDLYYDCALTRQGITLVDTPGADSVNARHTNVAFDYIKHSDAILYVTYYNHALSRADKDFLMQLGRVKEAFELDKMFFIINASDLAQNSTDLQLVIDYVEEQLLQLGIRFPKVFPVSSKQSLENKLTNQPLNEEMQSFEASFYHFVNDDLATLSIHSALWDINRAYQAMTNYLDTVNLNKQERTNYLSELNKKKNELIQTVNEIETNLYEERIVERIQRQLHFVEERITIRFHDMFKEHFNPTTITASGKQAQIQLESNLNNLLDYVGFELLQELRAVSLRLESKIRELAGDHYEVLKNKSSNIDEKFILPSLDIKALETPVYEQAFITIEIQTFSKALNHFKGTKDFFVNNGKETMKEELYSILSPTIKQYIQSNNIIMMNSYVEQWNNLLNNVKQAILKDIDIYINNSKSMISETLDIEIVKKKQQLLKSIIEAGDKE